MTEPLPFEKSSPRIDTFTCGTVAQFREAFNAFAAQPNNRYFTIKRSIWDPRGGPVSETIVYDSAISVEHLVKQNEWYNQTSLTKEAAGFLMAPQRILKVMDLKSDFDSQFALTRAESLAQLPPEAQAAIADVERRVDAAMALHVQRCRPLLKRLFGPKR